MSNKRLKDISPSISFYMDVHVARGITSQLRAQGIDVLTAQQDGTLEMADSLLLDRAGELGRILFSQDKDFLSEAARRQREGVPFGGVVFSKQTLPIGVCVESLSLVAYAMRPEEFQNRLLHLPL